MNTDCLLVLSQVPPHGFWESLICPVDSPRRSPKEVQEVRESSQDRDSDCVGMTMEKY